MAFVVVPVVVVGALESGVVMRWAVVGGVVLVRGVVTWVSLRVIDKYK